MRLSGLASMRCCNTLRSLERPKSVHAKIVVVPGAEGLNLGLHSLSRLWINVVASISFLLEFLRYCWYFVLLSNLCLEP